MFFFILTENCELTEANLAHIAVKFVCILLPGPRKAFLFKKQNKTKDHSLRQQNRENSQARGDRVIITKGLYK